MLLTTSERTRDVQQNDHLIAALNASLCSDVDDFTDLCWLRQRQPYILAILAFAARRKARTS